MRVKSKARLTFCAAMTNADDARVIIPVLSSLNWLANGAFSFAGTLAQTVVPYPGLVYLTCSFTKWSVPEAEVRRLVGGSDARGTND